VLVGRRSGAGVVELRRMAMSSAHRGGGLGRALLRELVGRARDHFGARRVWLDVKAHNTRARRLYETESFVRYETRVGVIAEPDGSTSDLVLMRRELEPGISGRFTTAGAVRRPDKLPFPDGDGRAAPRPAGLVA
jgi:diamine N-acetyltransferase